MMRELRYAEASDSQWLDLHTPEGTPPRGGWPVVVFIHGGAWMMGNRKDSQSTAWLGLTAYGVAVASVDYRLASEAPFPACLDDCEAALDYLRHEAERLGIDRRRMAVAGDSAGGHLALMLATGRPHDFACCVALFPVTDFPAYARAMFGDDVRGYVGTAASRTVVAFCGYEPSDPNDPFLVGASPSSHVTSELPPTLLQHGTADGTVPFSQSVEFRDRALEIGAPSVELDLLEGADHMDPAFATPENMVRVRDFLLGHLYAGRLWSGMWPLSSIVAALQRVFPGLSRSASA